ncbi:hypothetical protein NPIL_643301 [Nephila pilipes]|uniref:Uncharacterized protein n=1 Tax=Nephila pilipes TaxID=299642 RepID=A0A8X6PX62_NEPPI|nr:hypothetical protein NPIL_643301 [Nephila pilipes]
MSVKNLARTGRLSSSRNEENIQNINQNIIEDRCLTIHTIFEWRRVQGAICLNFRLDYKNQIESDPKHFV